LKEHILYQNYFCLTGSTKSAALSHKSVSTSVSEANSVASSKTWLTILQERTLGIKSNSDTDSRDSLIGSKSTGKSHQTNSTQAGSTQGSQGTQESSGLSGSTQGSTIAEATVRTILGSTSGSSASGGEKNASNGDEISGQSKIGTNDTDNSTLVKLNIRDETENRDKISALQSKIETLIKEAEVERKPTSTGTTN
jgi:hypothetical protein